MSCRLSCWLRGHHWGIWSQQLYSDLFGNTWQLRWCKQCRASQRRCVG